VLKEFYLCRSSPCFTVSSFACISSITKLTICRTSNAKYAEFGASIGIGDGKLLSGELPRKQWRLVQAWIELHRDELMADWELAASGELPYKIDPL
jgi:hypothetical protein